MHIITLCNKLNGRLDFTLQDIKNIANYLCLRPSDLIKML